MSREGYRERFLASNPDAECVVCGYDDKIFVHHINGDRSDGSMSNLTSLCPPCHSEVHSPNSYGEEIDAFTDKLPEETINKGPYKKPVDDPSIEITDRGAKSSVGVQENGRLYLPKAVRQVLGIEGKRATVEVKARVVEVEE